MARKTLDNGRSLRVIVEYNSWSDARYFYVEITTVEQSSGAGDVRFYSNTSYFVSSSGSYYDTYFHLSNVDNSEEGFYRWVDTNTTLKFDRYTGSDSNTDIGITFDLGGYNKVFWLTMPAMDYYSVSYNKGSITGSVYGIPGSQRKYSSIDLTLSDSRPTADYGTFQHWNTRTDDSGTNYSPGGRYTEDDPVTLYAIWRLATFRVTFNANGGSNAPSSQTKTAGETLYLTREEPTRNNYIFNGWSTNSDGTGSMYGPGDSYIQNSDITFYARWIPMQFLIRYDANGGSGAPSQQYKYADQALELSTTIPYWTGHIFKKWSINSDGSGTGYNPGASYTRNEEATLYAVWDLEKYTISFDSNGGSSAPSNKTKTYGETLYLPDTVPRRTGYTFAWWNTSWDGSGTGYNPGDPYNTEGNATLYAIWSLIYYTISFDLNYEDRGYYFYQRKPYGVSVNIQPTPHRELYIFDRWNTNSSGTGTNYQPGASYTSNNDLILYAIWKPMEFEIVYDANGGSNAPDPQTKLTDVDLRLSSDIPVRAGYTFSCWADSQWPTNPRNAEFFEPGQTYTYNHSERLYAVWTPGIFYDANGGSGAPNVQPILDSSTIILSTITPVRDNHTFLYWNTNRNNTGTRYYPGDSYTPVDTTSNVFLYAIWRRDPDNPTISSMLVTRRNEESILDDEGLYMHISVTWNVDTVRRSGNRGRCRLYYKESSSPTWLLVLSTQWSESATSTKLVSDISTDSQYDVKAIVIDSDDRTTERIDVLTRAKFVWDIAVGGEAMGIGSAAPHSGLEVGWLAQLDENVTMLKNLSVTGIITTPNKIQSPNFDVSSTSDGIIESSAYWTVSGQVAYIWEHICCIAITLSPPRTYEIGEVNEIIATLGSEYRPIVAQSFGTYWGLGYIDTTGKIYFRNHAVISDSNQLQIGLTYLKQNTQIQT